MAAAVTAIVIITQQNSTSLSPLQNPMHEPCQDRAGHHYSILHQVRR